jgi:hypothetical protein
MLISFLALIALVNVILGLTGVTLETILGYAFAPVALLMGVPMKDALAVGSLLGLRMVANEFIAYSGPGTHEDRPSIRAPSPSPPSPSAGSRTSRPSASRSAASAPWPPSARTTSAGWACAR